MGLFNLRKRGQKLTKEEIEKILDKIPSDFQKCINDIDSTTMNEMVSNRQNEDLMLFELGVFLFFRVDMALCRIEAEEQFREYVQAACEGKINNYLRSSTEQLKEYIDVRIRRYAKITNITGMYTKEFFQAVDSLAFGLVERAADSKNILEWEVNDETILPSGGITSLLHIPFMEEHLIAPLVKSICEVYRRLYSSERK